MNDPHHIDVAAGDTGTPPQFNCRICKAPSPHVLTLRSQRHHVDVPVHQCASCDAHSSVGFPVCYDDTDLAYYYVPQAAAIMKRYESVFAQVETIRKPGRFIDIGAGIGYSLEVAIRRGWTAEGIEPNRSLAQHASGRGLRVHNGYLDGTQCGKYDFILIDNVLEHIGDPVSFLRMAAQLLAPGGVMVVAVPPVDWFRKLLGKSLYVRQKVQRPQLNIFIEVDEHLTMFTRRAMARAANLAGLRLKSIRFHHSKVYDNAMVRALGLDDGYYFLEQRSSANADSARR